MKTFNLKDFFSSDGYYLTQSYGVNPQNYTKYGLLYHEGVDFGHSNKTKEVRACHAGECLTDYDTAYGRYVIVLDYKQLCATWYCHLSGAKIVNGQQVSSGDVIGNMGSTGNSTGPHVHFNFVQIDSNGTRLYKTKASNYGYLDPQHPLDPRNPTYPPGVSEYKIEWVKGELMSPNGDNISIPKKTFEELVTKSSKYDEFVKAGYSSAADVKQLLQDLRNSIDDKNKELAVERARADDWRKQHREFVAGLADDDHLQTTQDEAEILAKAATFGQIESDRNDLLASLAALELKAGKQESELNAEIARLKALLAQEDVLSNAKFEDLLKEIVNRLLDIVRKK